MQNWEYRSIAHRIDKLHSLPSTLERPCLSLSVAHNSGNNQLWVIESCAERMHEHVP